MRSIRQIVSLTDFRIHSVALRAVRLLFLAGFVLSSARQVMAAEFTCKPGDVACLIAAITTANSNGESNTIRLRQGSYVLTSIDNNTIDGPNGLPAITSSLVIVGAGIEKTTVIPVLGTRFSVFYVANSGNLTLRGLTASGNGGVGTQPIAVNRGVLNVERVALTGNRSGFSQGAAIFNGEGVVNIKNSTISGNRGEPAALYSFGGTMRITDSVVSDNGGALFAGALVVRNGTVFIDNSTFARNFANGVGGIVVEPGSAIFISNSSFVGNFSGLSGTAGALLNDQGTAVVTNTTFAKNLFPGPAVTSIWGHAIRNTGTLMLINSTIAENGSPSPVGPTIGAALVAEPNSVTLVQNTIIVRNFNQGNEQDCQGPIKSLGNNLIGDPYRCSMSLTPTDLTGDAGLGTFSDDGTPGNGHYPLLHYSTAIDAGNGAACPSRDQLGFSRGNKCDIGAVKARRLDSITTTAATPQN